MPRRLAERLACACLFALLASAAAQAQSDGDAALETLRPKGPVTLTADRAEWVQGGSMEYQGHVSLQSDTLTLSGDAMTVTPLSDSQFKARITGEPAELRHAGVTGSGGFTELPVTARAMTIDYDPTTGIVHLRGSAHMVRGSDEVSGDDIEYVVAQRRIRASGGSSGQVRIVIQPRESAAEASGKGAGANGPTDHNPGGGTGAGTGPQATEKVTEKAAEPGEAPATPDTP